MCARRLPESAPGSSSIYVLKWVEDRPRYGERDTRAPRNPTVVFAIIGKLNVNRALSSDWVVQGMRAPIRSQGGGLIPILNHGSILGATGIQERTRTAMSVADDAGVVHERNGARSRREAPSG